MVFGVIWRKTGKRRRERKYQIQKRQWSMKEKIFRMILLKLHCCNEIYEEVKQEERMAVYGCQAANKEIR